MNRTRTISLSLVLASAAALVTRSALAEPTPTELAVGRRLFKEAVALEEAGRWAEAAEKVRGAIAVKDTPGLRFHLARCLEEQGKLVEALLEYGRADDLIRSGVEAPDVVPLLASAREALEKRVPTLRLLLPADVASPSIYIDDSPVALSVAGQPAPLDPGRHRVIVQAAGRRSFERDVVLEPGSRAELIVELPVEAVAMAPSAEPRPVRVAADSSDGGSSARTLVLVSEIGFTAVSLGVGITFSVLRSSASDRISAAQRSVDRASNGDPGACAAASPVAPESCAELASAVSDRDQASTLMAVGFVGAGIGALATGLTWFLWPSEEPSARALRIEGQASSRGAMLGLRGAF